MAVTSFEASPSAVVKVSHWRIATDPCLNPTAKAKPDRAIIANRNHADGVAGQAISNRKGFPFRRTTRPIVSDPFIGAKPERSIQAIRNQGHVTVSQPF